MQACRSDLDGEVQQTWQEWKECVILFVRVSTLCNIQEVLSIPLREIFQDTLQHPTCSILSVFSSTNQLFGGRGGDVVLEHATEEEGQGHG